MTPPLARARPQTQEPSTPPPVPRQGTSRARKISPLHKYQHVIHHHEGRGPHQRPPRCFPEQAKQQQHQEQQQQSLLVPCTHHTGESLPTPSPAPCCQSCRHGSSVELRVRCPWFHGSGFLGTRQAVHGWHRPRARCRLASGGCSSLIRMKVADEANATFMFLPSRDASSAGRVST